ncbi:hypothetical protein NPIL_456481 [Nephila pilipes]|uniref:Uncharacterized protein n=1 Tax=Nephila pilipes TaxID=299642 RepID=A0A8X6Q1E3_NEPPI|nr:hypothetical protein NPIL_456481 [Nephila pilipes]
MFGTYRTDMWMMFLFQNKGKPLFSYWQPMEWNYPLKTAGEMISGSRLRSSEGLLTADYWKAGYDECGGGCLDDSPQRSAL